MQFISAVWVWKSWGKIQNSVLLKKGARFKGPGERSWIKEDPSQKDWTVRRKTASKKEGGNGRITGPLPAKLAQTHTHTHAHTLLMQLEKLRRIFVIKFYATCRVILLCSHKCSVKLKTKKQTKTNKNDMLNMIGILVKASEGVKFCVKVCGRPNYSHNVQMGCKANKLAWKVSYAWKSSI